MMFDSGMQNAVLSNSIYKSSGLLPFWNQSRRAESFQNRDPVRLFTMTKRWILQSGRKFSDLGMSHANKKKPPVSCRTRHRRYVRVLVTLSFRCALV